MARRKHTREFKISAVQLVTQQGYSPAEAARNLGVDAGSVRAWIEKFSAEAAGLHTTSAALLLCDVASLVR
jgi:transposase-like protein